MKTVSRICLGIVALGALAVSFSTFSASGSPPAPGGPPTQLVMVANTPLPVQGGVSVNNTPSVNVANTPNVVVANPSVAVSNALDNSSNPIPLLVSQRHQPYQSSCQISSYLFGSGVCSFSTAIPAGDELVIQEFDASGNSQPGGAVVAIELQVGLNGAEVNHAFPLFTNGTDLSGALQQAVHQQTALYSDTSVSSSPACSVSVVTSKSIVFCAISGYLVPAP